MSQYIQKVRIADVGNSIAQKPQILTVVAKLASEEEAFRNLPK